MTDLQALATLVAFIRDLAHDHVVRWVRLYEAQAGVNPMSEEEAQGALVELLESTKAVGETLTDLERRLGR